MTVTEKYEVKAEAFRLMTGHMAPGKDTPMLAYSAPFKERESLWQAWHEEHGGCVVAMLLAFEHTMGDTTE